MHTTTGPLEARAARRLRHSRYRLLLPHVRRTAIRLHAKRPDLRFDEIAAWAWLGVLEAAGRVDGDLSPEEVEAYAVYRLNGAVLDGLVSRDPDGASWLALSEAVTDAIDALHARLRRPPAHEEIAAELGMSIDGYGDALLALDARGLTRLEAVPLGRGELGEGEATSPSAAPLRDAVSEAVAALPGRLLDLLLLHYEARLPLGEAARHLGLDERGATTLHVEAIHRLRAALRSKERVPNGTR